MWIVNATRNRKPCRFRPSTIYREHGPQTSDAIILSTLVVDDDYGRTRDSYFTNSKIKNVSAAEGGKPNYSGRRTASLFGSSVAFFGSGRTKKTQARRGPVYHSSLAGAHFAKTDV